MVLSTLSDSFLLASADLRNVQLWSGQAKPYRWCFGECWCSVVFFCLFPGKIYKLHTSFLIGVHQINYSILYTHIFLKPRISTIKQMIDWCSGDEQDRCQFWSWVTYESGGEISRIVWSFLWWLIFPGFFVRTSPASGSRVHRCTVYRIVHGSLVEMPQPDRLVKWPNNSDSSMNFSHKDPKIQVVLRRHGVQCTCFTFKPYLVRCC